MACNYSLSAETLTFLSAASISEGQNMKLTSLKMPLTQPISDRSNCGSPGTAVAVVGKVMQVMGA